MAKGIVYIVQNPAFSHLFKIGFTCKKCVEDRGLDASNVPEDYKTLFAYECDNPEEIEKLLHETFDIYRHYTEKGRKTEFFYIGCVQQAKKHLEVLKKAGSVQEVTEEFQDDIDDVQKNKSEYDETKSIEKITKRPRFSFEKMGISNGEELHFIKNPNITVKVKNDRQVEYEGETQSFSRLTSKILNAKWDYTCPTTYWTYKGKSLQDIYDETYPKK